MQLEEFLTHWNNDSSLVADTVQFEDGGNRLVIKFSVLPAPEGEARHVTVHFSQLGEHCLRNLGRQITRENLQVAKQGMPQGEAAVPHSVFCNAALPFPERFVFEFDSVVTERTKGTRSGWEYLNSSLGRAGWMKMVEGSSYNILSAPKVIAEEAVELLESQGMEPVLLPAKDAAAPSSKMLVQLHDSWLECESASVELS